MEENEAIIRIPRRNESHSQSFLIKYGLKILLSFIVVVLFLTIVQCTIEKPEAPSWTTNLVIPAVNRTYQMPEIIRKIDQPNIILDSNGEVMFSFSKVLDTIRVSDSLSTAQANKEFFETIGQVTVHPSDPPPGTADLGDYVVLSLDTVPPTSFDIANDVPPFDEFTWANIASGSLTIKVINDFGLDLDTVIIQLTDLATSQIIATGAFPPPGIPAGETDSLIMDLTGNTISNHMSLNFHCHTPGAGMLSLSNKSLTVNLSFGEGMSVAEAEAEIPAIGKDFSESVELPGSHTIISAELASGNIAMTLQNNSNLTACMDVSIPDFSLSGDPLMITRALPPMAAADVNIDLTGYLFQPADQILPQAINIDVSVFIDSTAPNKVIINQDDTLGVSADISNLVFSSLTGIVEATQAPFENIAVDVELPQGFDSVQLVNAMLVLELENAVGFGGYLDLNISGDAAQQLYIGGIIPTGSMDAPVTVTFADSNLASFLNPVPGSITVDGFALFGDGSAIGTITAESYILPRISISSPLEFVIGQTSFDGDTASEEISQDNIDFVTDHVIRAQLSATITNHLPLGVAVEIYLDGDSTRLNPDQSQLVIGPITVAAGTIGPDGTVSEATESQVAIALDSLSIKILEHPILYNAQNITIAGSGGQTIKISGLDYVTISGVFEVECKVEDDK